MQRRTSILLYRYKQFLLKFINNYLISIVYIYNIFFKCTSHFHYLSTMTMLQKHIVPIHFGHLQLATRLHADWSQFFLVEMISRLLKRSLSTKSNPKVFFEIAFDGKVKDTKLVFELFADKVPKTAENFRQLCTGKLDGRFPCHLGRRGWYWKIRQGGI